MLSLVLGVIGPMLFFLPVLGLPLSALGLLIGLFAVALAFRAGGVRLRWSLLGCAMSALALSINIAIVYAPGGYLPGPDVPPRWQPVPDRPYVPPPALGLRAWR
jgi:hypothetical protein